MGCTTSKDMAVGFVLFNPAKSKRIIMNYLYTKNIMEKQGIPTFTLELIIGNDKPEIPASKNVFHVHGNSIMFHKEKLCRILADKIPQTFTKLVFCDADVVFQEKDWYQNLSKLLNTHDIVHPFTEALWKDLTYKQDLMKRKSSLLSKGDFVDTNFHPGFVWAFRRDWYDKVGFFDYAITGSGDTLSCAAWMDKKFPESSKSYPKKALTHRYNEFLLKVRKNKPRLTTMPGVVEHLWHGSRENRRYADRHTILESTEGIDTIISTNEEGVFEFKPVVFETWNKLFTFYFQERNDDDVSPKEEVTSEIKIPVEVLNSTEVILTS
jgi:hypothetical protein